MNLQADEAFDHPILAYITQNHTFTYDEPIKVESVTEAVGDLAMRFGESTADEDALMVGGRHLCRQCQCISHIESPI